MMGRWVRCPMPIEDLDRPPGATTRGGAAAADDVVEPRYRQRRQCPHCFANRSVIIHGELKGCEDRALQALRRAHPEEYDEYLRREERAAETAAATLWEYHLADKCHRARSSRAGRKRGSGS